MTIQNGTGLSLLSMTQSILRNRALVTSLIRRDIESRYRGSTFGLVWAFVNPLMTLLVYAFVFGIVFKTRWVGYSNSPLDFAVLMFAGLLIFNLFAECANRASSQMLANTNYIKKVVFPLEILPLATLGSALFHFCMSMLVWIAFHIIFIGPPSPKLLLLPIAIIPLLLFTIGTSWLLTSFGVYLRDTQQVVGILTTALLFLSPVLYPLAALPDNFKIVMLLNPMTYMVEIVRDTMMGGIAIPYGMWFLATPISLLWAWLGYLWFQKTKKGFADVL